MNQNLVIGILVALLVLAGGYFLITMNPTPGTGTNATSTPTDTGTTDTNGSPAVTESAPSVVTDASVASTNSTAVVTGKVTPNGAQTSYWYEYGQSANLGSKTASQSIGSGGSDIASPGYITGLRTNTLYYFRLTAQNVHGTVSGTTYSFSTNNNPPAQGNPPAASTNAAKSITRTGATLNAQVNPHSSPTTFWFEYGNSTTFGSISTFQSAGNTNTSAGVAAQISGLNPLTKYYFRINAQNQYGTVNGSTQSFTTTGPAMSPSVAPVVTTQVASPVGATTATLRGTVNPGDAQTTYWFEYSTDSLLGSVLLKSTSHSTVKANADTTSVTENISGLRSKTTYYYRTVAQNSVGTVRGDKLTITTK